MSCLSNLLYLFNKWESSIYRSLWTAAAAATSLQSCPALCDPIDGSPPGSSIPGILQARTLESVAISLSNAWKWKVEVKSLIRVWFLATPCSLSGSSIHGIFQARVLEWGAIAFSVWTSELSEILNYQKSKQYIWRLNFHTKTFKKIVD